MAVIPSLPQRSRSPHMAREWVDYTLRSSDVSTSNKPNWPVDRTITAKTGIDTRCCCEVINLHMAASLPTPYQFPPIWGDQCPNIAAPVPSLFPRLISTGKGSWELNLGRAAVFAAVNQAINSICIKSGLNKERYGWVWRHSWLSDVILTVCNSWTTATMHSSHASLYCLGRGP